MPDPLAITVGTIEIVTFAWKSAKTLYELVSGYKGAPKALQSLTRDVKTIKELLQSLSEYLKSVKDDDLSDQQKAALQDLEAPIKGTQQCCDALKDKIESIMSHSSDGKVNFLSRVEFLFKDKDVNLRKSELVGYQQTLNVALGVVTL